MNPLIQLLQQIQSYWLDFIDRNLLNSGELKRMVEEEGLRGMTSNPTIFEKAISSRSEYDVQIKKLALQGKTSEEIFEQLAIADIQKAADILKPVFTSSGGIDGYVSLEVSPDLAYDAEKTIAQAKSLFKKVKRQNLMIKVPGTHEGLAAIEELIVAGINVNVTLLFSVNVYKQVLDAYLKGLERRVRKGQPIEKISSVASFFVSRVDSIIDKQLDAKIAAGGSDKAEAGRLLHKAAIANAKLAYKHFEEVTNSERFKKLQKKGARLQRLLWASTSSKDKRLRDVIYIEELIGPHTVNTMPPQTAEAFKDHGKLEPRLKQGWDQAEADINALGKIGIDFEAAMLQLQTDGVKAFIASFESLLKVVGAKTEILIGNISKRTQLHLGPYAKAYQEALAAINQGEWIKRIWEKEASLWKSDPQHKAIIQNSLGWLQVPTYVRRNLFQIEKIVADIQKAKFTHALLLGMGGSSLCPEVLRLTFGKKAGYPDLAILDSTEPASVWERASRSKPEKTLYIVASKSGSTTEPNAFLAYFYDLVKQKKGQKAGDHFIAITDPGTQMERIAKEKGFRHIVLNPSDIGGRYSALSFFGMLPAALMGINVLELLNSSLTMSAACSSVVPAEKNPGAMLGAALGSLAAAGRNKVTYLLSKDIASFSTWVEQLVAESTGKEGKGILPVESEPLAKPATYGSDRLFVSIQSKPDKKINATLSALRKAGHPTIEITVPKKSDIAGEFFRWEFATAIAGAILGINPFDQPNVQESKDLTKQYLEQFKTQGKLDSSAPVLKENGVSVYVSNGGPRAQTLEEILRLLLSEVKTGDYVALLAYIARNPQHEALLQDIRESILEGKKVATTVGFGPRFLHSTGQLHKGGANNGVFFQITADDKKDLPIPGEPYSYSVLKEAQALGDLSALVNKHRRAIRIHLQDADRGLVQLRDIFGKITKN